MTTIEGENVTDTVLYDVEEGVATITLNRPDKKNAFDQQMLEGAAAAFERAGADDQVRVVVLTGAGDAFCAGGDVSRMGSADAVGQKRTMHEGVHLVPRAIRAVDKPVVARINGAAIGAGLDMALFCDLRIAAEDAVLSEGYINVGLVAGDGGAYLLPRLIGLTRAMELLLTGRRFSGAEAFDLGLVNRAVPAAALDEATAELVTELARKPPQALRVMKRLIQQSLDAQLETAMELAASQVAILASGDEHRDAVAAFRQRRQQPT